MQRALLFAMGYLQSAHTGKARFSMPLRAGGIPA
jgi:hypothetical protein